MFLEAALNPCELQLSSYSAFKHPQMSQEALPHYSGLTAESHSCLWSPSSRHPIFSQVYFWRCHQSKLLPPPHTPQPHGRELEMLLLRWHLNCFFMGCKRLFILGSKQVPAGLPAEAVAVRGSVGGRAGSLWVQPSWFLQPIPAGKFP